MNFLAIGISLVAVLVSVLFAPKSYAPSEESKEVLSATTTPEVEVKSTTAPTPKAETPTPTSAPVGNISQFQYPGSSVVIATDTNLILNSSDDPDKITDWYKEKIKAGGYNVESFVKTQANDEILNTLTAAGKGGKVSVVISKRPGESFVKITVNLE